VLKRFNLFLIFLLSFSIVLADNICQDNIQPLTDCQMVTPTLTSNFTYNVYQDNVSLFMSGNLTAYAENTYYFNFSANTGDYLVVLGDGTTREIYVNYYNLQVFGESFNWLAIIFIIIAISGICLWISKIIKNPDLELFKVALFFYGLINTFIMVGLTIFITSGKTINKFNDYFNLYVIIALSFIMLFIIYYGVFLIIQAIRETNKINK
jgi:hypothetical protein